MRQNRSNFQLLLSITVFLLFFSPLSVAPIFSTELLWNWNFEAAMEKSQKSARLILAEFSGSDWSEPSRRMMAEVLTTPTFLNYSSGTLVLLRLDYPQTTKLPQTQMEQNQKLLEVYGVNYFPTYLLLDPRGRMIWRHVGYYPGGSQPFIDHIQAAITTKNLLDTERPNYFASDSKNLDLLVLRSRYTKLQGLFEKADQVGIVDDLHWVVSEGVDLDDQLKEGFFYTQKIRQLLQEGGDVADAQPLVEKVIEWDPKNFKHYREEVELHKILAPIDRFKRPSDQELYALANKIASLTREIPNLSPMASFRINMFSGDFSAMGGGIDRALIFYQKALELAPTPDSRMTIEGMIKRLKGEPMDGAIGSAPLMIPPPPVNRLPPVNNPNGQKDGN